MFLSINLQTPLAATGDNQQLNFLAKSVLIDNYSNQWLYEANSGYFIPPYIAHLILPLNGPQVSNIKAQSPLNFNQNVPNPGEQIVIIYFQDNLGYNPGINVASLAVQPSTAIFPIPNGIRYAVTNILLNVMFKVWDVPLLNPIVIGLGNSIGSGALEAGAGYLALWLFNDATSLGTITAQIEANDPYTGVDTIILLGNALAVNSGAYHRVGPGLPITAGVSANDLVPFAPRIRLTSSNTATFKFTVDIISK